MKLPFNISDKVIYGVVALILLLVMGFASSKQDSRQINTVSVVVDNQYENYFIDQQDVLDLISAEGTGSLLNRDKGALNLKSLELMIEQHQFVQEAQVYVDLHGNMFIDVKQNRPIARIINSNGDDYYVGSEGNVLPESDHYTARVMLIELADENWLPEYKIQDSKGGEDIFRLIQYINADQFWQSQIAGMKIYKNLNIDLYPQVTRQTILFGKANLIEDKFKRLKTFYKKILPYKGWNTYKTVNLKFNDQIVCK